MAVGGMYLFICGGFDGHEEHTSLAGNASLEIMRRIISEGDRLCVAGITPVIQIGINSGPVAAGVIGTERLNWHIFVRVE